MILAFAVADTADSRPLSRTCRFTQVRATAPGTQSCQRLGIRSLRLSPFTRIKAAAGAPVSKSFPRQLGQSISWLIRPTVPRRTSRTGDAPRDGAESGWQESLPKLPGRGAWAEETLSFGYCRRFQFPCFLLKMTRGKRKERDRSRSRQFSLTMKSRADAMRRNPTQAELALDSALAMSDLAGLYRTQEVFAHRILDFWFPKKGLCVEVDGGYHSTPRQKLLDQKRDWNLSTVHVPTFRVTNEAVFADPRGVVASIRSTLDGMLDRRERLRAARKKSTVVRSSKKKEKRRKFFSSRTHRWDDYMQIESMISDHMRDIRREFWTV